MVEEAIGLASGGAFLHVSLDMDVVDPEQAPGVGTPVRGGITYREAHLAMEILAKHGVVSSLEVVEVNPVLDEHNATASLAVELVCSALGADSADRHPGRPKLLHTAVGGSRPAAVAPPRAEPAAARLVGQVLLVDAAAREVVRVLVTDAPCPASGRRGSSRPAGAPAAAAAPRSRTSAIARVDADVRGVRLRRAGQIDGRLGEVDAALRQADELDRPGRGDRHLSACGSALPTSSEAKMTIRRAMNSGPRRLDHRAM